MALPLKDLYVPSFLHRQALMSMANREFGKETASELVNHADQFAEVSRLAPNRCLELAIQFQLEFGQAGELFSEAILWVNRTAEDHHPHNLRLYLMALIWVVNQHRQVAS